MMFYETCSTVSCSACAFGSPMAAREHVFCQRPKVRLSLLIHLLSWFRGAARAAVANVYRRFIRDYTKVVAPLTRLTSTLSHFAWSEEANRRLCSHLLLFFPIQIPVVSSWWRLMPRMWASARCCHRGMSWTRSFIPAPFSVGVCIWLRLIMTWKIGSCWQLCSRCRKRHHWLVGSALPFVVWMDHKNPADLRSAKRLNSRQARRALFLGHFDFTLTYHPGPQNMKPDALSRQFLADPSDLGSSPIFSPSCIVGSAIW